MSHSIACQSLSQRFNWSVRVYYEDTDAGGRVYYVNYLKFMERTRTEWLRSLGWEQAHLPVVFVVRQVQIDYRAPALLDDLLEVSLVLVAHQGARLIFEQRIERDQQLLCQASIEVVCIDRTSQRPKRLPPALIASF